MLISVKTFIPATVALKLILLFANTLPATASPDGTVNCSNTTGGCGGLLADDEAPCPPDSSPSDPSDPGSPCVCRMTRCVQHVCRFGFIRQLKRTGTNTPGNCCDVHECVQPKEKNCSDVICPDEGIGCPADSYRLPNHRAPGDCCSHPQGCECLPGSCPEPECVSGQYPKVMRPGNQQPGTCCPLFKCVENEVNNSCILDGKVMKNGSTWWKNECTECSCNNGLTFCAERTTHCPELPITCRETRIPSGKCCPICVEADPEVEVSPLLSDGCLTSAGKIIQNEGTWQEDPCTSCTCVAGTQKCIAYMCVLRCEHPRYVPDECCPLCNATSVVTIPPHCPALSNCSLRCLHGFVRDDAGCYSCQCQAEECLVECPDGYKQDSHGNKLCECAAPSMSHSDCPPLTGCHKNCSHGFRLNKAGCEVCKCRECRPLADCNKNCAHGLRRNDRGCQICKCKASPEHIPDVSANNHIITETSCISADGQYHDDGEAWFDGCRQCLCYAGVEMCNLITCPVPTCTDPVFNSSQDCCPRCSGFDHKDDAKKLQQPMVCHSVDGVYRVEGETWPLDACTRCLCHSGRVLCETRKCPPVPCSKPVYQPGKCCPQCPNSSPIPSLRNAKLCAVHRPHGSIWMEDNCRSCICLNGETSCYTQQCPPVSCGRPVLAKNQCCPMCLEQSLPKTCTVGNVTYHLDEEWNEDTCTQCKCSDGQKMCTKKVCSISCTKPVKKPGKCCPICSEADNNSYADSVPAPEDSSLGFFMESTYIIIILVLLGISTCLALYIGYQCHRHRQQLKLESMPKSCPNPAYHGYTHRNLYLPPTYTRGDRHKSKVDPYQYKCVSPYDTQQINDMYKTPSYEETEKSALNSV